MSFEPINNFLNNVYSLINSSDGIKYAVKGVYISINQNPLYPFIFININKATDRGNFIKYAYNIDFNVSIFFREKHPQNAFTLAYSINEILSVNNFAILEYKIVGLQKQDIVLSRSEDTLTTKLNINYLSYIR
jgi:hypothetical protein